MRTDSAPIRLQDYRPPLYSAPWLELEFRLDSNATRVLCRTRFERMAPAPAPLELTCGDQIIRHIRLDGHPLPEGGWTRSDGRLVIPSPPAAFTLEIETELSPAGNTALEGLYMSGGRFCTQCEAEGFRSITPALDRPDSLSRFTVRIEAEQSAFPVLLSNGDLIESGSLDEGRHYAVWRDPHLKPTYLFALVAGKFEELRDTFVTASGRAVRLGVYVDQGDAPRARYALDALKRAMRWDEQVFGREYDLDVFNIVAVRDFNFGAMENKGLNIFNSAYVLADMETATDADFEAIESVVAHEYFHNWTGNRITLRDWFQLCLKEGLTVFRDQEFSADMRSRGVQRIKDVRRLRARQFVEDAGPLAHSVRPSAYVKIDNFYTATVYEKGAEIVRMLQTLLGPERFAAGMAQYFDRCDGTAATVEDFLFAFEQANGEDLSAFRLWYAQVGTPKLRVERGEDEGGAAILSVSQEGAGSSGPTPPIPLRMGWLTPSGEPLGDEQLLVLTQSRQRYSFRNVPGGTAIPALLRGFSAPVRLVDDLRDDERLVLMAHEPDPFVRWEAGQHLARSAMLRALGDDVAEDSRKLAGALRLELAREDRALSALMLRLPDLPDLFQQVEEPDPKALHEAHQRVKRHVTEFLTPELRAALEPCNGEDISLEPSGVGARALRVVAMDLWASLPGAAGLLGIAFSQAKSMTIAVGALEALGATDGDVFDESLQAFHARWHSNALVLDKWFAVQAAAVRADSRARLNALLNHPEFDFTNPNRVRSLAVSFAQRNLVSFHAPDGWGYAFLAEVAKTADRRNPALGARLLAPFEAWRRLDPERRRLAQQTLETLQNDVKLSKNAQEVVGRMLNSGV